MMFPLHKEVENLKTKQNKKSQKIYDPFNSVSFHFKWPL